MTKKLVHPSDKPDYKELTKLIESKAGSIKY